MTKVYCSKCDLWKPGKRHPHIRDKCLHPDNLEYRETPQGKFIDFKNVPADINKNNDCVKYHCAWWRI